MVFRILLGVAVAGGLIQLVPTGYRRSDPAVIQEPAWDSPRTRELAKRACFNCHSNETLWPWYSEVAPISWLTERDVKGGRSHLNFSEWSKTQRPADELTDQIQQGLMPPWFYLPMHPEAKLTAEERNCPHQWSAAIVEWAERELNKAARVRFIGAPVLQHHRQTAGQDREDLHSLRINSHSRNSATHTHS